MMNQEGPEGDEPDFHPEELQGEGAQGEKMELFIVPPDPPRTRAKRGRSRAKPKAPTQPQPSSESEQAQRSIEVEQPQRQPTAYSSASRLKSKVWQDFTRISNNDDDVIIAECNHCKKRLSGKSSNEVFQWYSERDSIFKEHFWPSEEEWAKVSHMYQFLEVFFKVTTIFSGTKYPTANLYFMNVYLVHTAIREASAGINNYMADMLHVMREKFMKYWSDYSVFLSCAAVLDPRIKFKFLMYAYSKLYDEVDAHRRITDVRNTLTSLFNEYGSGSATFGSQVASSSSSSSTCGLGAFDDYDQYVATTSSQEEKSELDLYLAEPVKRLNENIDILDYWSKSAARYLQLAKMARDILAILVSSVASESAFSLSKKVITPNRSSLKPKTVEALMCLEDWYRCKMQKKAEIEKKSYG